MVVRCGGGLNAAHYWCLVILNLQGKEMGGGSSWESTKTRVPVFILHWGEAHGQQLPGMDYKKVAEEAGLEGTEASQRASAWERDAAESARHSWEVLQRSPLSIRRQGFGGQAVWFQGEKLPVFLSLPLL